MTFRSHHLTRAVAVAGLGLALSACSALRDAANLNKASPDEFSVVTKAPLVIPPDFNLMPPKPGAEPTNQVQPTDSAETALYGDNTEVVAAGIKGDYSQEERYVLAKAGISSADPEIREHLASDQKAMLGANDSFTNDVLFWKGPKKDDGTPVNADAAAKGLDRDESGQPVASAPAQKKDNGGWFDGWFDWF